MIAGFKINDSILNLLKVFVLMFFKKTRFENKQRPPHQYPH